MRKKHILPSVSVTCVLILFLFSFLYVNKTQTTALSDTEKIYGLSEIWKRTSELFGLFELLPGLDWDGLYREYIPRVLAAKSKADYYRELNLFVANLNDGHSMVTYPSDLRYYIAPVYFSYVDGKYIVFYAQSDLTKIPIGSVVSKIDDISVEEYVEQNITPIVGIKTEGARQKVYADILSGGYEMKSIKLEVTTPDGTVVTETVKYDRNSANFNTAFQMQPEYKNSFPYKNMTALELEDGVFYVKIPDFLDIALIDEFIDFIDRVKDDSRAFIIDVRGHNGGNAYIGIDILCHFINPGDLKGIPARVQEKDVFSMALASSYYKMNGNDLTALEETHPALSNMLPLIESGSLMLSNRYYVDESGIDISYLQRDLLEQRVILLCDYMTASAGEDFIAYAKDTERFIIMGTNTKGTTGQIARFDLPGGGTYFLSTRRCLTYDGQDITNLGIIPDIFVQQTYDDLLAGVDSALNTAVEECRK